LFFKIRADYIHLSEAIFTYTFVMLYHMTSKPTIDLRYSDQIFQSDVSLDAYCTISSL